MNINEQPAFTFGQITIKIFGYLTTLNIIPNKEPIEHDGIQGAFQNKRDFFKIAIYSGAIF